MKRLKKAVPTGERRTKLKAKQFADPVSKAPRRRIVEGYVTTIALCRRGKNRMPTIYKSDSGKVRLNTLSKEMTDAGELLAVIYAPNVDDIDREFADRASIKKMAYRYARDHRQLDIEHDGHILPKTAAFVAENFIIAKGDERFAAWKDYEGNNVDLEGAWAQVIKIDDPALRSLYREGKWNGVSMFGSALKETVSSKSARDDSAPTGEEEKEMTKEEIEALTKSVAASVMAELKKSDEDKAAAAKAEATAAANAAPKAEARPEFKGDPMSKADREKYVVELRAFELRKAIKEGASSEDIAKMFAELDQNEPTDAEAGIKKADTKEVQDLKRRLFKAEKRSNQTGTSDVTASTEKDGISKEDQEAFDMGKAIAAEVNANRGIKAVATK